jgi:lipopolysaccharide biosynthesis glycosyltransferase
MGFDGTYAMAAAVAMRSLGQSLNDGESATMHILAVDLSDEDRQRIERSTPPSLALHWYDFDPDHVSGLPVSSVKGEAYITRTAYALLFFDRYLPPDVQTVLYLDADTLVRKSPLDLVALELNGHTLAAVQDFGCSAIALPNGVAGWRELGLDGRLPAFNTGFLLIDRAVWNSKRVEARSVDYLTRFSTRIHYVDQDCLNATNAGDWHHLHPKWNYQALLEWDFGGDRAPTFAFIDNESLEEARRDPAIVHYAGGLKPWLHDGETLPFFHEWRATLEETAWSGTPPEREKRAPVWKVVRFRVRRATRALLGKT